MTKSKKKKNIPPGPPWRVCRVVGYITACDPGILTTSDYPKEYDRVDLKVGMNLCGHCSDLPKVQLKAVGPDHIVVRCSGVTHRINTGDSLDTPRMGLSSAYSEATITLVE